MLRRNLSVYPSAQWKLLNIEKLQVANPEKHKNGVEKLASFFIRVSL
jgi:hypothetical protein